MRILGLEISTGPADWAPKERGRILIFILLGFTAFNYIYHGLFRPVSTEKVDFVAYYNAALAFKYAQPLYEPMIRFFKEGIVAYNGPFPYVYPPCFVIFLSPLAYLSFKQAALLWTLFNHACFFMGIIFLMKAIKRRYSLMECITLIFVCMNFTPLFIDYLVGQCNIVLFFLITLGLYFYRANKGICAGIALGFAVMIKIIPGLLVAYMLWKRQYKTVLSAVSVLFLVFIYSLLFFDVDLYLWYFEFMGNQGLFNAYHDNHSLTGFFSRLLTHSIWTTGVLNSTEVARICILVSSILMLLCLFYITRRITGLSDDQNLREYSLVIISMLLASKMTSTPYLVMLLIPLGVLVHELFQYNAINRWVYLLGAAYGILAIWHPLPVGKFLDMNVYKIYMKGFAVHIFSLQFFALLVLWWYFAFSTIPVESNYSTNETCDKADLSDKHHGSSIHTL